MAETALILNVDDDSAMRYARNRVLKMAGYEVVDAGTGAETLALARDLRPDLILLDVHLPDMNGINVCRQLKCDTADHSMIIIQISASAVSVSHTTVALDAGADAYLAEPVDADVLLATVNAMLRLHRAERSLAQAKEQLEDINKELRRSNEDLQQFAFAASHDLQEPLRAITTFTQILQSELRDASTEQQREYFDQIISGAGRMRALIRDLLAYSQVGREDRQQSVVDLAHVVEWALENVQEQMKDLGGEIEIESQLPSVWGDFAHLGLVFQNLISNSLKYHKPDEPPAMRVTSELLPSGEWRIRFSDNGIGIGEKYREYIFAPFKRLHSSDIPGTGIGLALCRRIVESHGGRIWVDPDLAEGAAFFVTFPKIQSGPSRS